MAKLLIRRLGAALLFIAGLGVFASSNLETVRFSSVLNGSVCSAKQVINLPEKIDVALIGSSRIRRGISTEVLKEESRGEFTEVYNFGRPYRQILRSESLIAHLLEAGKRPSIVVLEIDLDVVRMGSDKRWSWSPGEAAFLSLREVLAAVPPTVIARQDIMLRAMEEKLRVALARYLSGDALRIFLGFGEAPETVCWRPDFDLESEGKQQARATMEAANRAIFGDLEAAIDDRFVPEIGAAGRMELAVLDRIRHRLAEAGVRLVVVRPNGYTAPLLSPAVIGRLSSLVPELRLPPEDLAIKLTRMHMDGSHYSPAGRELFSRWLTGVLLAQAEPQ